MVVREKKMSTGLGCLIGRIHHSIPHVIEIGSAGGIGREHQNLPSGALGLPSRPLVWAERDAGNDRKGNGHLSYRSDNSASTARKGMRSSRISSGVRYGASSASVL